MQNSAGMDLTSLHCQQSNNSSYPQNLNYQQYQSDISVLNADLQTYKQRDGHSLDNTAIGESQIPLTRNMLMLIVEDGIGSLLAAGSLLEAAATETSHYPPTIDDRHLEPIRYANIEYYRGSLYPDQISSHYLNPNQQLFDKDTDLPPPGLTTIPQHNCAQDTAPVQFQSVEGISFSSTIYFKNGELMESTRR